MLYRNIKSKTTDDDGEQSMKTHIYMASGS